MAVMSETVAPIKGHCEQNRLKTCPWVRIVPAVRSHCHLARNENLGGGQAVVWSRHSAAV